VLGELESAAEKDADTFRKVWDVFGTVIKEGLYEDRERRAQLLSLCRFTTTAGEQRTLKQYVADLRPNQTEIYYLVGESIDRLKAHPALEAARARGIEVLLLSDPIDAFWTMLPTDHEGKGLKSLSQGDVDFGLVPLLDGETDKPAETDAKSGEALTRAVKEALGDLVSDVRTSRRLTDSAACLVASAQGPDRELERLLARQNRGAAASPILELNMSHDLVRALAGAVDAKRQPDIADLSALLFDQAQILDGQVPGDPAAFARRLNDLVLRGLRN
jgi:molecular chaperone HtpG